MEEESFEIGKKWKNYLIILILILVTASISYYFGKNSLEKDLRKIELFNAYTLSFNACKEYCGNQSRTGYLRVETETNLKCFCW